MLTFFRRIRKGLLEGGRTSKYLLYAIGEIALVVIGILIAIGLNNWRQEKQNDREVSLMLHNLKAEFLYNQSDLEAKLELVQNSVVSTKHLLSMMNTKIKVDPELVDSLLSRSFVYGSFNPRKGATDVLINSGKLNLVKSNQLRTLIASWKGMVEDAAGMEKPLEQVELNQFYPYLQRHASITSFVHTYHPFQPKSELPKSKFQVDNRDIFQDVEFENILSLLLEFQSGSRDKYKGLQPIVIQILKLTEEQL